MITLALDLSYPLIISYCFSVKGNFGLCQTLIHVSLSNRESAR